MANEPKQRTKSRGNGDGTISRRRGKYTPVVTVAVVDGKPVRRWGSPYPTAKAANAALRTMLDELGQGITGAGEATVNSAIDDWLTQELPARRLGETRLRQSTIDNYAMVASTHIRPYIGNVKLNDLRPKHVDDTLKRMATAGKARSTIARVRSILVQSLKRPVKWGDIPRNVAELVDIPDTKDPAKRKSLTVEQAQGFVRVLDDTQGDEAWNGYRYAVAWVLQLQTGMRPGEARALRWADIDWPTDDTPGRLHVRHSMSSDGVIGPTKTRGSVRTIDLPAPTIDALQRHRDRQAGEREFAAELWVEHDLVFPTQMGTACTSRYYRRSFERALKAAGIDERFTPHELRHSCISILSDQDAPDQKIADLVGWSDTRMMSTYRHLIRDSVDTAVGVMENLFSQ
jgi:integrase